MGITFPGESAEYRAARDRLLEQEIELRRAMEAVAAARRELPPGGVVPEDYVFQGAGAGRHADRGTALGAVRAGQGLAGDLQLHVPARPGRRTAGARRAGRRRFCRSRKARARRASRSSTSSTAPRSTRRQHVNLAVVAKAPLPRVLTFAEERGWRRLRLLSSAANTYNRDYLAETAEGAQRPMLNVFHRDGDTIRHFWGSELFYAPTDPGQDPRHVGTLEPVWNLFDLTPEGRPADWDEQLSYA